MKRFIYLDWLRVLATIAVVTIHVSAGFVSTMHPGHLSDWLAGNLFETISRSAVPIFVMISGALLLQDTRDVSYWDFFKKRTSKVVIPFVGWSIIFYLYGAYAGYFPASFKHAVHLFLTNGIGYHMWFLYMIIGLYLITPLLKIFVRHARRQDIQYFLLLWLYASVITKLMRFWFQIEFNIELFYVSNYVGYFLLGYYLAHYPIAKAWRTASYFGACIGLIVTFIATYFYTVQANGQLNDFWYSYFSPTVVLISIGLFVFFRYRLPDTDKQLPIVLREINQSSLGIYILHYFLLTNVLYRVFPYVIKLVHPILAIPIDVFITLSMSALITLLLRRIPIVNKLVP